ncbi:MAG TPA: plastocyanin/azurin family copper-binding protein, partial [Nitrosopumilaceae archaeon]|nr:plastocyanin/azurin family copper-binding protein [Nitrosopumilaceae archaeon]
MTLMNRNKILYFVLPMILVLGIYGTQISYEKSGYFVPLHIEKSNSIMIVSIDNSNFKQGQSMNVTGKVNHSTEGVSVLMQIIDPTNKVVGDFHSAVNRFGIFNQFFNIPDTFSSGKYILTAYYEGDPKKTLLSFNINISNTPYGQVYILIPFGASTEGNNINFDPSSIIVPQGTKIVWTNNDANIHDITSGKVNPDGTFALNNLFEGGFIPPGQDLAISPNPGNYTYFCKIHPWLDGTISVKKTPVTPKPVPPVKAKQPIPPVKAKQPVPPVKAKQPVPPVVTPKTVPPLTAKPAPSTNSTFTNSTTLVTNSSSPTGSDNFLSVILKDLVSFFTGGGSSVSHNNNTTKSNSSQTAEPTSPVSSEPKSPVVSSSPSHDPTLLSYWTFDNNLTITKDQGVLGKNLIQVGKGKIVSGR